MMTKNPKKQSVSTVFEHEYIVPIYQRNYAWEEVEIIQLIEDIDSSINHPGDNYFLGNLIVNLIDNNVYEVIDGQQRLTTLYLLNKYLNISMSPSALTFEAREKSNQTLKYIRYENKSELVEELLTPEILQGYEIIKDYFEMKEINKKDFVEKLNRVFIVRVQVPQNIDLNHYFEIMNTRGEQLELHEIAKAKLLEILGTDEERSIAALIWEKCSDMDAYIQMNFTKDVRDQLFTNNWTDLDPSINHFESLENKLSIKSETLEKSSLIDILQTEELRQDKTVKDDENENKRFESTIIFPNFLLQVNAVVRGLAEEDSTLDDKNFLDNLAWNWQSRERAKNFIFHLLKLRVLFDQFILKREFARYYKETGKWSLQRLEKYRDQRSDKPKYVGTLGEFGNQNQQLRTLQSSLRITYTSPKTMHWITIVLSRLLEDKGVNLIQILETYSMKKVEESNYESSVGFGFERIVFSYLDYLIYRDGYSYDGKEIVTKMPENWQFQFRSSIEHFHPQNPVEGERWDDDSLNEFGNLALITVSGNSRFSNLPPDGKISSYPSIINQSWKLKIMEYMTKMGDGKWTKEKSEIHKQEMFRLLKNNRSNNLKS